MFSYTHSYAAIFTLIAALIFFIPNMAQAEQAKSVNVGNIAVNYACFQKLTGIEFSNKFDPRDSIDLSNCQNRPLNQDGWDCGESCSPASEGHFSARLIGSVGSTSYVALRWDYLDRQSKGYDEILSVSLDGSQDTLNLHHKIKLGEESAKGLEKAWVSGGNLYYSISITPYDFIWTLALDEREIDPPSGENIEGSFMDPPYATETFQFDEMTKKSKFQSITHIKPYWSQFISRVSPSGNLACFSNVMKDEERSGQTAKGYFAEDIEPLIDRLAARCPNIPL